MRVPAAERATHAYRTAFACQRMLLMIPNLRTHMCEGVAAISNGGQLRVQRSALTLNSVCYAKTHSPCIIIMGYAGSDADEVPLDDVAGGEGVQKCANSGVDSYCCIDGGGCDCASGTSTLRFQGTPSVVTTIGVTSTSSSSLSTTSSSSSSPSTTSKSATAATSSQSGVSSSPLPVSTSPPSAASTVPPSSSSSNSALKVGLGVGIPLGALVLVLTAYLFLRKRKQQAKDRSPLPEQSELVGYQDQEPLPPTHQIPLQELAWDNESRELAAVERRELPVP